MEDKIINLECIHLDLSVTSKEELLERLSKEAVQVGAGDSSESILEDLWNREKELPTAVGKGIAIPHCRSKSIKSSKLLFYRLKQDIDWDVNEKINLVFAILTPDSGNNQHLVLLSKLSRHLLRKDFLEMLKNSSKEEIINKIKEIIGE
ncbi:MULTISPECIES: PTS sugar transporter subunit IIA [Coprobacillaceae]|uniref:PTS sugar transporter subunit IIA n=1 Tax=Coprobacillaceae TaxID=2810280 RepID=UPI00131446FE|nr:MULTISPECIES: PTS sugar transporter subunit IIA [Coprobacillaceae]